MRAEILVMYPTVIHIQYNKTNRQRKPPCPWAGGHSLGVADIRQGPLESNTVADENVEAIFSVG